MTSQTYNFFILIRQHIHPLNYET